MAKNRGSNNGKHLMFKTKEQRCKFILLYKDLFVPYSDKSDRIINAIKSKDDASLKQLREGYCLNQIYFNITSHDIEGYELLINIEPDNWHYICDMLKLKRHNVGYRYYKYWSLE